MILIWIEKMLKIILKLVKLGHVCIMIILNNFSTKFVNRAEGISRYL